MTAATDTLGTDLLAAARERSAARHARRSADAANVAAGARIRAMSDALGDDPTSAALLAAAESGERDPLKLAAAAESGTRSARSQRGTMDRAAQRQADREAAVIAADLFQHRENLTDATARVLAQYADESTRISTYRLPLSSGRCGCRVPRCKGRADVAMGAADLLAAWQAGPIADVLDIRRERGGRAIIVTARDGWTPRAAALSADGPTIDPDHDPATCGRNGCRRCGRPFDATSGGASGRGPLVTMRKRNGRERPTVNRAHRRPMEQTSTRPADLGKGRKSSDGQVAIIREASVLGMMDRTRDRYASRLSYAAVAESERTASLAVTLVDAVTVPSVGRRGYRVAWESMTTHPAIRRTLLAAAAADVAARFSLRRSDVAKLARRADLSADALAVAWAAADPDPIDAYAAQRPAWRARKRAAAQRASVRPLARRPAAPLVAGRPIAWADAVRIWHGPAVRP